MLRKVIKWTDFNGVEREEAFYFNLTKAEMMKMELSVDGGFTEFITRVVAAKDSKTLVELFDNFILTAYGEKSDDGKRFVKNKEIVENFKSTEAYSQLFMELMTDESAAIEFINGLAPADPNGEKITKEKAQQFLADKMR